MLSHISRRRNVRVADGEGGFVAWLQEDFSGKEQLFACDALSFERSRMQQDIMICQIENGVKLMELIPNSEDCDTEDGLSGRAAVVSEGCEGDFLYVVHVPSGASSRNMLPAGHRVRSIISSPSRPEHLLLVMRSASSESQCDDVFRLDLVSGQLVLDTPNPGFVTQWAVDSSTLSVRACVCAHSVSQHDGSSPLYVKARGRGGWGPWVHVCELPHGGHVAGFADGGGSLVVMNRNASTDVTFVAEKHQLSPLFGMHGERQRAVLCASATGNSLAVQVRFSN
jgi:hypothetical protein